MRVTFLAFYFGFGVLTNLMVFGPINWSSWMAWAVLLMWPALWFAIVFIAGVAIWMALIFICWVLESIEKIPSVNAWAKRRNERRIRKFLRTTRGFNRA